MPILLEARSLSSPKTTLADPPAEEVARRHRRVVNAYGGNTVNLDQVGVD
jgi:hypothetical protein